MAHTVLVVEDSYDIREAVLDLLGEAGFEAVEASNGSEALAMIHDGLEPSAIVLDLMMPKMSGEELFAVLPRRLRARVIFVTASILRPRAPGAFATLRKPFERRELLDAITAVCGASASA